MIIWIPLFAQDVARSRMSTQSFVIVAVTTDPSPDVDTAINGTPLYYVSEI